MHEFKIAAAQFASVRGDLAGNIRVHAAAIAAAAAHGVSVLVFPELSLIGYGSPAENVGALNQRMNSAPARQEGSPSRLHHRLARVG